MPITSQQASALVLHHTTGVAIDNDTPWSIAYVAASDGSGLVIAAPDRAMARSLEMELHIPDETLSMTKLHCVAMVSLSRHSGEGIDRVRWEAYHAQPPTERWLLATIDAVRVQNEVFDADDLDLDNPLIAEQSVLCKQANSDPQRLARAVGAYSGTTPDLAHAVGVDPWGVHVRGVFVVHRLPFAKRAGTSEEAQDLLARVLETA